MAGVFECNDKSREILCLDVAGLQLKDKQEFQKPVKFAEEQIRKHFKKSLLLITNVIDTGFDTEVSAIIGEYTVHNTPYVKASALVGVSGVQKVVLAAIKALTGRDFYLTNTVEDAQEWLIQQ
jgi:energy-converting hydrogenase Eha subunit A